VLIGLVEWPLKTESKIARSLVRTHQKFNKLHIQDNDVENFPHVNLKTTENINFEEEKLKQQKITSSNKTAENSAFSASRTFKPIKN
jgi:hypothetical protein